MSFACGGAENQVVNYRHAFHAGSFADVFKHAVLCRILHYLRGKPAAFRVIDTHAGAGLYDLTGAEASRGGEWHDGIERLLAARLAEPVAALLAPYLDVIGALHERGRLKIYPGPPAVPPASGSRGRPRRPVATCATTAASRRLPSTAGPRCRPMCRRRSGAAWCWSIRRSNRMPTSTGCRTALPTRIPKGRPACMPCGTR